MCFCSAPQVVLASIWLLGFIIAAVPLMNEDIFGNYYGRNGVCFPLHSDRQEKPTAKGYSTGIFLGKCAKNCDFALHSLQAQLILLKNLQQCSVANTYVQSAGIRTAVILRPENYAIDLTALTIRRHLIPPQTFSLRT